jgi:hypothetical protein
MFYYVRIKRMNGRNDFYQLARTLNEHGYEDRVEYFPGGWNDTMISNAAPHLRFTDEGDAVAYCLTHGCTMSIAIPHDLPTIQ